MREADAGKEKGGNFSKEWGIIFDCEISGQYKLYPLESFLCYMSHLISAIDSFP